MENFRNKQLIHFKLRSALSSMRLSRSIPLCVTWGQIPLSHVTCPLATQRPPRLHRWLSQYCSVCAQVSLFYWIVPPKHKNHDNWQFRHVEEKPQHASFKWNGASLIAQSVKNLPAVQETRLQSLGWEDQLEMEMANPLQYPCLENLMDRGAWWAAVHGVAKSRARLSDQHLLTLSEKVKILSLIRKKTNVCWSHWSLW